MSNLTVANFRRWKGNPTAPDDDVIQAAIDAAEYAIGEDTERYFTVASGTSARTYVPNHPTILRVHDCVSVTSVVNDGATVASSNYQLEPVNASLSGHARPYTQIRLLNGHWWDYDDFGAANVTVTASWGWTALPAPYTEATKILAADILDQRALQNGIIGFTEYAGVRVRANPMVASLLAPLRRVESWGIG